MDRTAAIDQMAADYAARRSYFAPACGLRLLAMAEFMDPVASALYIDGGREVGEVMQVSPGAMETVLRHIPPLTAADLESLSGVYVIPADTPLEKMQAAFPGAFADGQLPEQRVLLTVSAKEAATDEAVAFAPIMLDVVGTADPLMAVQLMDGMIVMRDDGTLQ